MLELALWGKEMRNEESRMNCSLAVTKLELTFKHVCLQYMNKGKDKQKMSWVFVHFCHVKYMKNLQILKTQTCTSLHKQIFFFLFFIKQY